MIVTNWAVKNRIVSLVISMAAVVGGAWAYVSLPREAQPEVQIPFVFISTQYRGVAPLDVEQSVTVPIEKELRGLSGVKRINSTSSEGMSQIVVEFEPNVDIDEARQRVKDRVDRAERDLPADLDGSPDVFEINLQEFPIVRLVVLGPLNLIALKDLAQDIADDMETIPGVLECEISGGLEREVVVEADADRVVAYGLPLNLVTQAIVSENQAISGGALRLADGRFQVRVPGDFDTLEEAQRVTVAVIDGKPIYLEDVAEVIDGNREELTRARLNYQSAISIDVKKRVGANIISIVDEVDRRMTLWSERVPAGVSVVKVGDIARFIRWMVADLENNLFTGFVLVLVVVFFAMGVRNALLVSLSIPLSMLITFLVLDMMGVTLNMIVLFSLILALGMLVDNAIVIIENIHRFMQAGVPRVEAACRATSEVAWPIIGSSLTTIAAFAPLLFWSGIMGDFMSYLPLTVIITLVSSLFVALVINPAFASYFMKLPAGTRAESSEDVVSAGEQPVATTTGIIGRYRRALGWTVASTGRSMLVLVAAGMSMVVCILIWFVSVGYETPIGFFPATDPDQLQINIDPPVGASLDYNDAITREIERRIRGDGREGGPSDIPDIKHVIARSSVQAAGFDFMGGSANHVAIEFIDLDARDWATQRSIGEIRQRLDGLIGADFSITEEEMGPPTGDPINVEIRGDNIALSGQIAARIREVISRIPGVFDVRDNFESGAPTFRIAVDRHKAALMGVTTQMIGNALRTGISGSTVSTFRFMEDEFDITVRLPDSDRETIQTLERFFVPTTNGGIVPLTTVADIRYEGGYSAIHRIDHERTITVVASVDERVIPGTAARMQAEGYLLAAGLQSLPAGTEVSFTGQLEFEQDAQDFLGRAFVIAIFVIAGILVSLFNSVTKPFIILTSVIISTGGAFLGLAVVQQPFILIMSGVGLISLAGVVVNNGIVLVDYTDKLRSRGFGIADAVVSAGATRLRPVLLTAFTTILGLVPMVTGIAFDVRTFGFAAASRSTQMWTPMAIAIIFGLALATFLTLFVAPVLYHMIESARTRLGYGTGDAPAVSAD